MSVVLIGPPNSGKKTSLLLLHQTLLNYAHVPHFLYGNGPVAWTYTPIIRDRCFDIYRQALNLILDGRAPAPTPSSTVDQKIEFYIKFRQGLLHRETQVKLLLADMGGEITCKLLEIFPEIISSTPLEVRRKLLGTGLNSDDAEYLTQKVLSVQGVILVADASTLDNPNGNPDAKLATFLDNLNQYSLAHGEKLKAAGLMLTKFDPLHQACGLQNLTENALKQLVKNYLPMTENVASDIQQKNWSDFKIFYSTLIPQPELDEEGKPMFRVEARNARNQRRVEYSVQQYLRLIHWLADTFEGPIDAGDDVLIN